MVLVSAVLSAVCVGFFMLSHIGRIDFNDVENAIPAFITLLTIPLTYSIAHGIGYGFITYVAIKLMCGKFREIHILMYVVATAFTAYFLFGAA